MTDVVGGHCMAQTLYGGLVPAYVVWNGLIILLVMLVFYWLVRSSKTAKEMPHEILVRRLASGEISKQEYEDLKKELAG
jgi:uncharacterized membrane protein